LKTLFQAKGPAEINVVPNPPVPVDLTFIAPLFIFLLVGYCFAVVALVIEVVYHRRQKQVNYPILNIVESLFENTSARRTPSCGSGIEKGRAVASVSCI
jgi:hypothetical protein